MEKTHKQSNKDKDQKSIPTHQNNLVSSNENLFNSTTAVQTVNEKEEVLFENKNNKNSKIHDKEEVIKQIRGLKENIPYKEQNISEEPIKFNNQNVEEEVFLNSNSKKISHQIVEDKNLDIEKAKKEERKFKRDLSRSLLNQTKVKSKSKTKTTLFCCF